WRPPAALLQLSPKPTLSASPTAFPCTASAACWQNSPPSPRTPCVCPTAWSPSISSPTRRRFRNGPCNCSACAPPCSQPTHRRFEFQPNSPSLRNFGLDSERGTLGTPLPGQARRLRGSKPDQQPGASALRPSRHGGGQRPGLPEPVHSACL